MNTVHLKHLAQTTTRRCRIVIPVLAALIITCTVAYGHEDIAVLRTVDDQLLTGVADHDHGDVEAPIRVYEGAFGDLFFSNDPGFVAPEHEDHLPPGHALLPPDTDLGFSLKAFTLPGAATNLAYWNGIGSVDFAPVTADYSLDAYWGPMHAIANGSGEDIPGFIFAGTDSEGGIHEHLNFQLSRDGGTVAEGIYAWALDLNMPGMQDSEPFFILHETSMAPLPPTLDLAVDWVNTNYDALTVPEPSSLVMLSSMALGTLLWYRRRR